MNQDANNSHQQFYCYEHRKSNQLLERNQYRAYAYMWLSNSFGPLLGMQRNWMKLSMVHILGNMVTSCREVLGKEKVQQWMLGRWGEGYRPTVAEIDAYIQHELGYEGGVASTRITTQHQQTTIRTCPSMASPNMPVQYGAEQNNNPMIPTAPPGSLRGEQHASLVRYYHGHGSGSHSASNDQTIGPHITQPNNSETQRQDRATDQNAYDPRFNWKTG